ncbi:MAG TPA: hypothetical protein DC054_15805, partial [Blastocatellia bacterium]|nr:hypothetical protein [Blastocatellia bacterium]
MPQLNARNRFWAVIAAQGLGVMLLILIGIIFDMGPKPVEAEAGLQYLWSIAFLALLGLVASFFVGFVPAHRKDLFEDVWVDKTIEILLYCDIPLLTILVCKQGGLSKSVFFPLFLMIPVAHRLVERDDQLDRVTRGAIWCGVGMLLCCVVSISGAFHIRSPLSILSVTDYSTLPPKRFAL